MKRRYPLCALLLAQWGVAGQVRAEPSVTATTSVSAVSGPTSGSATAQTLTGPVTTDGMWNPRLRFSGSARFRTNLPGALTFAASWGIWRDQALCDTCDDGAGPGAVGNELLGSTDLSLSVGRGLTVGKGTLQVAATAVLPASRDALVCNPMVGAPGASASLTQPTGRSSVQATARFARPFYVHSAAPVGLCAPALRGATAVDTLAGAVEPTPWDGTWSAGANPSFTASTAIAWIDPHDVFKNAPAALTSQIRVGLDAQRNRTDPATTVTSLTGEVPLAPSSRPLTASIPWSVAVGISATDRLDVGLTLGNRLPTWLADPGGTIRALPARTTATVSVSNRF